MSSVIKKIMNLFGKEEENTLHSRFPIRFKLLLIISFVLLVSVSGVIFLASYFFRKDSERQVMANNLKINEILSLKVKSDLEAIRLDIHISASAIIRNQSSSKSIAKELFEFDKNFILVGAYGPGLSPKFEVLNDEFLENFDYRSSDIQKIITTMKDKVRKAYSGSTVIINVSPYFRHPMLCLAFPLSESKDTGTILVTLVKLDHFLSAFQTSGMVETFLIAEDGSVLAHPDAKIVLSGSNLNDLPIVEKMKKSNVDNGQIRYESKEGIYYLGSFKKLGIGGVGVISQVEEKRVFEEVENIQKRNMYLLVIFLALAFIVVYIFAQSLSTPILSLVNAARMIQAGQYHLDLKATTRDEIGVLTRSFVSMGKGLEEREKLKDSFGRFVNTEIAELAAKGKLAIGGQRKKVAIFFSDIRGFTTISEKLEPEEVVEFLNEYMSEMVTCVKETGGIVDKFIGDAIMATWGALRTTGQDSLDAVEASVRMRERLMIFNKGRGSVKRPRIRIGCGINTGNVIAGQMGSADKMEYTVIGDAVNLASRLESLNKESGTDILISEYTYADVKHKFNTISMGEVFVKGKAKAQKIFAVLGRKGDADCPKTIAELRTLVGIPIPEKKKYEVK